MSGVVRYKPDGSVSMVVKVPVRYTTCPTFGGSDLQTMYITDASVPWQTAAENTRLVCTTEARSSYSFEVSPDSIKPRPGQRADVKCISVAGLDAFRPCLQ